MRRLLTVLYFAVVAAAIGLIVYSSFMIGIAPVETPEQTNTCLSREDLTQGLIPAQIGPVK